MGSSSSSLYYEMDDFFKNSLAGDASLDHSPPLLESDIWIISEQCYNSWGNLARSIDKVYGKTLEEGKSFVLAKIKNDLIGHFINHRATRIVENNVDDSLYTVTIYSTNLWYGLNPIICEYSIKRISHIDPIQCI